MGSLYVKGKKLWARYKDEHGKWKGAPTPFRPGAEAKARVFVRLLENQSKAKGDFTRRDDESRSGPITVAVYAKRWVSDRKQLGLVSAGDDDNRLTRHALSHIGEMTLEDVRPRHLKDVVLELRKRNEL